MPPASLCSVSLTQSWGAASAGVAVFLLLIVLFRALQYMLSILLAYDRPRMQAILRLKDALATVLLFLLIQLTFPLVSYIGELAGYGSLEEMVNQEPQLLSTIRHDLQQVGHHTLSLYTSTAYLSTLSVETSVRLSRFSLSLYSGLSLGNIASYLPYLGRIVMTAYGSYGLLSMAHAILCFVLVVSALYLLPLGLILRASGLFSRLGSTLIAVGVTALLLPLFSHAVASLLDSLYTSPSFSFPGELLLKGATLSAYTTALMYMMAVTGILPIISLSDNFWDALLLPIVYDAALLASNFITGAVALLFSLLSLSLNPILDSVAGGIVDLVTPLAYTVAYGALYTFSLAFFAVGLTRALAIPLGGEYFLYRVADYVG